MPEISLSQYNSPSANGPSILLRESGSQSIIPTVKDYHKNLTQLKRYSPAGPGDYDLPSLFDNYRQNQDTLPGLSRHPMYHFGLKASPKQFVSKDHMRELLMT